MVLRLLFALLLLSSGVQSQIVSGTGSDDNASSQSPVPFKCSDSLVFLMTHKALIAEREENERLLAENRRLTADNWEMRGQLRFQLSTSPRYGSMLHETQLTIVRQGQVIRNLQKKNRGAMHSSALLKETNKAMHKILGKTVSELTEYQQKYGALPVHNKTAADGSSDPGSHSSETAHLRSPLLTPMQSWAEDPKAPEMPSSPDTGSA